MTSLVVLALLSHAQGFHVRVSLAASREAIDGLLVMDIDGGEKCRVLRQAADVNRDGVLSQEETGVLKKRLMGLYSLKATLAGYELQLKATDVKLSLREDRSVEGTGLSLAVMLEGKVSSPIAVGMELTIEAKSPDSSPVVVELSGASPDGGVEALAQRELQAQEKLTVRLQSLGSRR